MGKGDSPWSGQHGHGGLCDGRYRPIRSRDDVLAFVRTHDNHDLIVALNIAAEPRKWTWQGHGRVLLSAHLERPPATLLDGSILLRGNEGAIIAIDARD